MPAPKHPFGPPGDARLQAQMKAKTQDRASYDLAMLLYNTNVRRFKDYVDQVVATQNEAEIRANAIANTRLRKRRILRKMR